MLDGNRIAAADSGAVTTSSASSSTGTRTVELEQISINNAARIEVVKARTPDLPADALGGSLNLVSKSAFEYAHPEIDYRLLMSMNTKETSTGATPGEGSDVTSHKILPSYDVTVALPINKKIGFTFSALGSNVFNPQWRTNPQWSPNGTYAGVTPAPANLSTAPVFQKYTMQDGPKVTHRKAYEATMDWKVTDNDLLSVRWQDNNYSNFFGNRNINFDTSTTAPVSYTPTSTNGALGKGNVNFSSSFRNKFGTTWNLGTQYTHTGHDWIFDAGANYSHATARYHDLENGYFNTVTYQIASSTVNYAGFDGIAPQTIQVLDSKGANTLGNIFDMRNPNYKITKIENNPVTALDTISTGQVNLKKTLSLAFPTTLKFGLQDQREARDLANYKVDWLPAGALALAGAGNAYNLADTVYNVLPPFIPQYPIVWPSQLKMGSLYAAHPELFTSQTALNQQQAALGTLQFREDITSAYAMGDTQLLKNRLRLVYGVRFERTADEGWGPLVTKTGTVTTYTMLGAHAQTNYSGYYPSLNATYNLTDNLLFRASYNKAVGRPDIVNIVPNVNLPDSSLTGQKITVSNPLLKAEQADNYDASLEYYFNRAGMISVGVFQKDFTNFWGSSTLTGSDAQAVLEALGVSNAAAYISQGDVVTTPINVGTARTRGVEFSYMQSLASIPHLPEILRDFSVFANYTAIDLKGAANADFSAFVDSTLNYGLSYTTRRISVKLNWNFRGREKDVTTLVNGVNYSEYFAPRHYFDANFEFRLTKSFGLFVNGRNLTNSPQDDLRYAKGITPDYARLWRREYFGTAVTMGLKGSF